MKRFFFQLLWICGLITFTSSCTSSCSDCCTQCSNINCCQLSNCQQNCKQTCSDDNVITESENDKDEISVPIIPNIIQQPGNQSVNVSSVIDIKNDIQISTDIHLPINITNVNINNVRGSEKSHTSKPELQNCTSTIIERPQNCSTTIVNNTQTVPQPVPVPIPIPQDHPVPVPFLIRVPIPMHLPIPYPIPIMPPQNPCMPICYNNPCPSPCDYQNQFSSNFMYPLTNYPSFRPYPLFKRK